MSEKAYRASLYRDDMAHQAVSDLGPEQRIMLADKPVEEAITQRDVIENVMPWGGVRKKLAQAALGVLYDATYGHSTKDYDEEQKASPAQSVARVATDAAFGAKKSPAMLARTFAPMVMNKISKATE